MSQLSLRNSRYAISFLFIFSGITSLVYEIVWSRILSTILGNTSLAISITVSIFMAGLAIGSFLAARMRIALRNPFFFYSALELLIGVYSACTPWLAQGIETVYGSLYGAGAGNFFSSVLFKAAAAALLLLVPTVAMGATLPILLHLFSLEDRKSYAGILYGLNTAGAVFGTILAGYFMLPALGIRYSIFITALCSGCISAIAYLLGRSSPETGAPVASAPGAFHPLYLLVFLTGFATLSYEILWTRALSMFFGSSVYAFSAILASFLLGIASGSRYYAKRIPAEADAFQLFSLIQFRLALAAVFFVGIFMGIPFFLIRLFQMFYWSFGLFQIAQFLLIGCCIFYATFLSGAAFPAAIHFFRKNADELPARTGYIYTYNTIGGILGSFVAAFLLIPFLGTERSLRIVILINLVLGILCFRRSDPASQDKRVLAIGGASLALLLFLPRWDQAIYNSGFYAFAYKYVPSAKPARKSSGTESNGVAHYEAGMLPQRRPSSGMSLIYYAEGLTANIAVVEQDQGVRSLLVNGKPDASNVPTGDMRTQLLLGHLPVLLRGKVDRALVIGLGSGVTAGALSAHGPVRIDCVEIEKKVVEASRYFETENNSILKQPNFRLILDDGRNFVQHSAESYDVITSEPSNLWMSGVANLFTREFFITVKKRLRPHGVMCQWIHLYQISLDDILIFLKTFHSVFPHLSIWIDGSDMLLLGSADPLAMDSRTLAARLSNPKVQASLKKSDLDAAKLWDKYLGDERIVQILRASIPLNTDNHPILEFSAPRSLFWNRSEEIVRDLYEIRAIAFTADLPGAGAP